MLMVVVRTVTPVSTSTLVQGTVAPLQLATVMTVVYEATSVLMIVVNGIVVEGLVDEPTGELISDDWPGKVDDETISEVATDD